MIRQKHTTHAMLLVLSMFSLPCWARSFSRFQQFGVLFRAMSSRTYIQTRPNCLIYAIINDFGLGDIKFFLEKEGSNPDDQDASGQTALHYAVKKNDTDAAQLLLAYGADAYKLDKKGKSALDYAREKGNSNLIDLLKKSN